MTSGRRSGACRTMPIRGLTSQFERLQLCGSLSEERRDRRTHEAGSYYRSPLEAPSGPAKQAGHTAGDEGISQIFEQGVNTGTASNVSSRQRTVRPPPARRWSDWWRHRALGDHQRRHAGHQRDGGHENGAQTVAIGLDDRVVTIHPASRSPLVWSICRIAFFFTMPNSSSNPSPEKMLTVWPASSNDRIPNGTASGSVGES